MCAVSGTTNNNSQACFGDSGSALSFYNPDTSTEEVCAITSFGGPTCDASFPVCFTVLAPYFDFIYSLKNAVSVKEANAHFNNIKQLKLGHRKESKFVIGKQEIRNIELKDNLRALVKSYPLYTKKEWKPNQYPPTVSNDQ